MATCKIAVAEADVHKLKLELSRAHTPRADLQQIQAGARAGAKQLGHEDQSHAVKTDMLQ